MPYNGLIWLAVACAASGSALAQPAPPSIVVTPLGLSGPVYRDDRGNQEVFLVELSPTGVAAGMSTRFDGRSERGWDAWMSVDGHSVPIGYHGPEYTSSLGFAYNTVVGVDDSGRVAGVTTRFDGVPAVGTDAWLHVNGSLLPLGLTGATYQRTDGFASSSVSAMDSSGRVIGGTRRYNGTETAGFDSWLRDDAGYHVLGLSGPFYDYQGWRHSTAFRMNNSGHVAGTSNRYNGTTLVGEDAWQYDSHRGTTVPIGLSGSRYTSANDRHDASIWGINERGFVIGTSSVYNGFATRFGQDAWLFRDGRTIKIGPNTAGRLDTPTRMNEAGQVIGKNGPQPQAAWFYNGSRTVSVGLTGAEYTGDYARTEATDLNESGQVIGYTELGWGGGRDVWIHDNSRTRRIGLTGPGFDGFQRSSTVVGINDAGFVLGHSTKYAPNGNSAGNIGWLYDSHADAYDELTFSSNELGESYTLPRVLTEEGVVLGSYYLFEGDSPVGLRAFWWSTDRGFADLGSLVSGGLSASGWEALSDVIATAGVDADGYPLFLVGAGIAIGEGTGGLYLAQVVPAPGSLVVLLMFGCALRRRRATSGPSRLSR